MSDSVFPQAFIIGANKSGTTTLGATLNAHPDVCVSEPKEPCTFSDSSKANRLHLEYPVIFDAAKPGQMRVEASTTYSRWPYQPTKWHPTMQDPWPAITKHSPGSKLIYLVRHPVDRMASQIKHRLRTGNPERMTMEGMMEESDTYLNESRYRTQIEYIRRFVPEDRWFVETFDRFNGQRKAVLGEILEFLDLPQTLPDAALNLHENRSGTQHILSRRVNAIFGAKMVKRIIPKPVRKRFISEILRGPLERRLRQAISVEPMKPETRMRLLGILEPDIQMIESILGRDLPDWRR